ncbi:hypothetical protein ACFLZ6_00600 [Nanoarchaeota archaeon]
MDRRKIAIIVLAFVLIFGMHYRFDPEDNDMWLHLVSGKVIYDTNSLPEKDVLTFTILGEEWSMHEWLYQLSNYITYAKTGLTGLLVVKTLTIPDIAGVRNLI